MKKRAIAILMVLLMSVTMLAMTATAAAAEINLDGAEGQMERVEQVIWYYRTYNGVEQKRLWSITYNCWITDWIDVT